VDLALNAAHALQLPYVWDLLLLLVVGYGVYSGWRRGVVGQAAMLGGLVAAVVLAVWQGPAYASLLTGLSINDHDALFVSSLTIYLGLAVVTVAFLRGVHWQAEVPVIQMANRGAGAALGSAAALVALLGIMLPLQLLVSSYGYHYSMSGWLGRMEPFLLSLPQHLR
jgi:uncharacterized membrane protein required for colicin V production